MNTKLTLNINENVVNQAKIYAKSKKRSVSKLVEEYLYSISTDNKAGNNVSLSPITQELLGAIKTNDRKIDYKKELEKSLIEKYS